MDDHIDPHYAIFNVRKASRLTSISPDHNFIRSVVFGLDDFSANCCRRFFTTTIPRSVGTVDIMETCDKCFHLPLCPILLAQHFSKQFFPTVSTLWHGGEGVWLFK